MEFEIKDGVLIRYHKNDSFVVIPETVRIIGAHAFEHCNMIGVLIPESVTEIRTHAFFWCRFLMSVTIPESVRHIANYAFLNCERLEQLTISEGVENIGAKAFSRCYHLKRVSLPASLKRISWGTFKACTSLTEVTIPESITEIEDYAFDGCKSLTSISIPESVICIGGDVFHETPWLKQYPDDFVIINGILLKYKGNQQNIAIPEHVTTIIASSFKYCESAEEIHIPEGVTSIEETAFQFCTGLKKIHIPDSVKVFGKDVFRGCWKLTEIFYHGTVFTFDEIDIREKYTSEVIQSPVMEMIINQKFIATIAASDKYKALWTLYFADHRQKKLSDYIRRHFTKMCKYLIDENQAESVQNILNSTEFVTRKNIDNLISFAIEKQKHEIQIMLVNYKYNHIGYEDSETIINRKFRL